MTNYTTRVKIPDNIIIISLELETMFIKKKKNNLKIEKT